MYGVYIVYGRVILPSRKIQESTRFSHRLSGERRGFSGGEHIRTKSIFTSSMYGQYFSADSPQPDIAANPAHEQLKRQIFFSLCPFAPDKLVSRDRFDHTTARSPFFLRTEAEPGYVESNAIQGGTFNIPTLY